MELREGGVISDLETSPNRGFALLERHFQLVNGDIQKIVRHGSFTYEGVCHTAGVCQKRSLFLRGLHTPVGKCGFVTFLSRAPALPSWRGSGNRAIDRGSRDGEQLRQIADRILAAVMHSTQLFLLFVRELGSLASQLSLGAGNRHAFSRAHAD